MAISSTKGKQSKASKTLSSSSVDLITHIRKLELALTSQSFDPNPLIPLIALARHDDAQVVHKAVWALHRVLIKFIGDGRVAGLSGDLINKPEERGEDPDEGTESSGEKEVKVWVRERLLEYVEVLGGLVRDSEPALRASSIPLLFSLLPPLSNSVSPPNKFIIHIPYFRLILNYLIFPRPSLRGAKPKQKTIGWKVVASNQVEEDEGTLPEDVIKVVVDDFWAPYDDLRWAFFKEASPLVHNHSTSLPNPSNLLSLLLPLTNLPKQTSDINAFYISAFSSPPPSSSSAPAAKKSRSAKAKKGKAKAEVDALPDWMKEYESSDSEDESEIVAGKKRRVRTSQLSIHASIYSIPSHTTLYSTMWETVLSSVPLSEVWTRKILVALHGEQGILEHFKKERRLRVADWLGSKVDEGGAMAMLAMNGLFVLMTQYNFEYPRFYDRLYALLDQNLLHVKYRARFFRLLDIFLSSSLMPATTIASFIKRLSRLALSGPPAGVITVLPFIYNLFKRHPGCMVMLQRPSSDPILQVSSFTPSAQTYDPKETDPYDETETSPLKSKAIDSSCWELAALQGHYLASISTLAKVFGEVFTKPEFNMEDFLDHGYTTLFETEGNRKIKNPPALSVGMETGLEVVAFPSGTHNAKQGEDSDMGAEGQEKKGDLVRDLWAF